MPEKPIQDVVREYFPNASDDEVDCILWSKTGYPGFLEEGEKSLREQLQDYKNALAQGKDICGFCGGRVEEAGVEYRRCPNCGC